MSQVFPTFKIMIKHQNSLLGSKYDLNLTDSALLAGELHNNVRPQLSSASPCRLGHSFLLLDESHALQVRMTWGKALLPWTSDPGQSLPSIPSIAPVRFSKDCKGDISGSGAETALKQTCHLNHKFALDGLDPSSYGGILWCFGQFDGPKGTHTLACSIATSYRK